MARFLRSYPKELHDRARALRESGLTYSEIISELGGEIPKATLQGWVRDIKLTTEQRERIKQKEREAIAKAQLLGAQWNHEQKLKRLQEAEEWATPLAERLAHNRDALLLLVLGLYLGEGRKGDSCLDFGNSDPDIIRAWMTLLRECFEVAESKFACQICISEGMPEQELTAFWSEVTGVPVERFIRGSIDRRPKSVFRDGYKGVCRVIYYSYDLRRKLGALARRLFDKIEKTNRI